jgi:hypothetical protein
LARKSFTASSTVYFASVVTPASRSATAGRDSEPPTVYVDGFTGDLYLDKPAEVEHYSDAFETIWAAAASEGSSARLIRQAADDFRSTGRR